MTWLQIMSILNDTFLPLYSPYSLVLLSIAVMERMGLEDIRSIHTLYRWYQYLDHMLTATCHD